MSTKFDRAFCVELQEDVTPYTARDYYTDEESKFFQQKLEFRCPEPKCGARLVAVSIYAIRLTKRKMHFRTHQNDNHKNCDYSPEANASASLAGSQRGPDRYKETLYPRVFLLERDAGKGGRISKSPALEATENQIRSTAHYPDNSRADGASITQTSSFEAVIDYFLNAPEEELRRNLLTIGTKTKYYRNFFKEIPFFRDEQGLIYFGEIKEIKPYGKNFGIKYKRWALVDEQRLPVSIYIKDEHIEAYRKRRLFRRQLEALVEEAKTTSILCFFVGSYPEVVTVNYNGKSFQSCQVEIDNLDHIAFRFEKHEPDYRESE